MQEADEIEARLVDRGGGAVLLDRLLDRREACGEDPVVEHVADPSREVVTGKVVAEHRTVTTAEHVLEICQAPGHSAGSLGHAASEMGAAIELERMTGVLLRGRRWVVLRLPTLKGGARQGRSRLVRTP